MDINLQDNNGWTALLRAGQFEFTRLLPYNKIVDVFTVILQCKQEVVDYLIVSGANIYIKDNNGFDYVKHQEILSLYKHRGGWKGKTMSSWNLLF